MARKYAAAWQQIKQDGYATIVCAPQMHRRLINALRKERTLDTGWSLLLAEQHKRAKLRQVCYEDSVFFYLTFETITNVHTI